jgi:hypothetical protein
MKAIPLTPLTLDLARRIIWFEPPEHALADPIRFMAYAMTYARHEDMRVIRRYLSDDDIREALDRAPPGIIDPRSWAYWNSKMGRYPPPPLPVRTFPASAGTQNWTAKPNLEPAKNTDLEDQRRAARMEWQQLRKHESSGSDMEDVRRQAREDWRKKVSDSNSDSS